jgi:hypothetical protein
VLIFYLFFGVISEHVHEETRARRMAVGKTRTVDWRCPVCKLQLAPSKIQLDAFVLQILQETSVDTKEVIVDSDGLYHAKSGRDAPLRPDQVSFVDLTGTSAVLFPTIDHSFRCFLILPSMLFKPHSNQVFPMATIAVLIQRLPLDKIFTKSNVRGICSTQKICYSSSRAPRALFFWNLHLFFSLLSLKKSNTITVVSFCSNFSEEHVEIPAKSAFDPQRNINSLSDNELLAMCGIPLHILQAIVEFRAQKGSCMYSFIPLQSSFHADCLTRKFCHSNINFTQAI